MNLQRASRLAGYFFFFDLCFVAAAVLMFPLQGLKPLIVDQAEKALGKGKQGKNGVDPVVTIGDLGMSGLGVSARRVQIQLGSTDPEAGPTIDLDAVRVSASLLSAVSDKKTLQVDADLYKGDVAADITIDEKQNVTAADIEIEGVELAGVGPIIAALGVPVEGKLTADIDLVMGAAPEKDAKGTVDLHIKDLAVGAGALKLPGGFDFTVEHGIALGTLALKMPVEKGQGAVEARFEGAADVEAEATGTLNVKGRLPQSRLELDGWFKPAAAFLDKNPTIKSAIEIGEKLSMPGAPSLSKSKDGEGRYHFEAKGALQSLKPQLSRDAGRRSARKRNTAPPPTPDLPEPAVAPPSSKPAPAAVAPPPSTPEPEPADVAVPVPVPAPQGD